jgi:hypothetical protein
MKYEEKIEFVNKLGKVREELRELVYDGIRFRSSVGISEELDKITDPILHAQIDIGVAEKRVKEWMLKMPNFDPYEYKTEE